MQILLANAKIMREHVERCEPWSEPLFQAEANLLAAEMGRMDRDELARQLDCSVALAAENRLRYQAFAAAPKMPALLALCDIVGQLFPLHPGMPFVFFLPVHPGGIFSLGQIHGYEHLYRSAVGIYHQMVVLQILRQTLLDVFLDATY